MSSDRSKRRKVKTEINLFNKSSILLNIQTRIPAIVNQQEIIEPVVNHDHSLLIVDSPVSSIISDSRHQINDSNFVDKISSCSPIKNDIESLDLKQSLASWAVNQNVPINTLNVLLNELKAFEGLTIPKLPKDARTLLKTPCNLTTGYRTIDLGIYYHFGLEQGIRKYISRQNNKILLSNKIEVSVGIDGLPLTISSGSQFWPILAYIVEELNKPEVFIIGLYHGYKKPKNSDEFVIDFVQEASNLCNQGLVINEKAYTITIHSICCDAPARSYILKIKGHSGYSSCSRCYIHGENISGATCFPYSRTKSAIRTHDAYVNKLDEDHHISDTVSIISKLPSFDVVQRFPFDYMHLTNLGIMRKLLSFWVLKGPAVGRLCSENIIKLNFALLSIKECITSDFPRKPRGVNELSRWKATELRQFLIYTGPIVLPGILSEECFLNFMSLNVSMIILLSTDLSHLVEYGQKLLEYFIETFDILYGSRYVSYNVHGLIHLCEDYKTYGPLDKCSCYPFENFMKELKSMLRKYEKSLQQVVHRYYEKCNIINNNYYNDSKLDITSLHNEHTNGPLVETITVPQFTKIIFPQYNINVCKKRDSYILTCGKVIKCVNIAHHNQNTVVLGYEFLDKSAAYIKPMDSTKLDIYQIKNLSSSLNYWKLSQIKKKMMVFFYNHNITAVPIIHTRK